MATVTTMVMDTHTVIAAVILTTMATARSMTPTVAMTTKTPMKARHSGTVRGSRTNNCPTAPEKM